MVEELHDALHIAAFLAAREELAIGESACASFAKAIVGLSIESLVSVEYSDVLLAFGNLFTAFVDDGAYAVFYERECGKQARRTCPNDGYAMLSVVHILEMWWLVEWDGGILR